jgi:Cu2+-exporting ATPase
VIIAFVLAGKIIETRAKFSAKDALIRLDRALPRKGRKKLTDGSEVFVPLKEIDKGERVVVLTGERVPLDGTVESGEGLVDESALTGESIPVQKCAGNTVLSGGVLKQGRLILLVTSTEGSTTLHRMIKVVEEDINDKPVALRAVDRVIQWFVPVVILVAIGTFVGALLYGRTTVAAVIQAITVLLISCPCAIGVAAPLVESQMLNALAKLGAIVRNRAVLPALAKVSTWCFDKTGTVTEGRFCVQSGLEKLDASQQGLIASLAACSHHPIASAIADALPLSSLEVTEVTEIPGRGITAIISKQKVALGSSLLLESLGITPKKVTEQGSRAYFAVEGECLTVIILDDSMRPEIPALLHSLGSCTLLSGDAEAPVQAIAAKAGFCSWRAQQTPLEKRQYVWEKREEGNMVAMVGDGINDAPALTVADVGISVVRASDISVQVSDLLLTSEKLDVLPAISALAVRGQRILWQNLVWAFSYNVVGICLAAANRLSPLYAAIAMVCSSLVVLLNAQRLNWK